MTTLTFDLPAMYGDHHVAEVRRLLFALPGVGKIYASSSFRLVELEYDPAQITPDAITTVLDESGYMSDLALPNETAVPATEANGRSFFRQTAVYQQTGKTVGFSQQMPHTVGNQGQPLWPCPGVGPIQMED